MLFLYGFGNWSLTLGKKYRLKVFESRELRRIFLPRMEELTGGWKKL
jgi:hypothetical protein